MKAPKLIVKGKPGREGFDVQAGAYAERKGLSVTHARTILAAANRKRKLRKG